MCQGSCSTNTCQQTCSPTEARLRHALAEIQKHAQQQLQLRGKDGQPHPGAFAMQFIATLAEEGLAGVAPAPAPVTHPVTVHRGSSAVSAMLSGCGCRTTADCSCRVMDQAASMLYQSHAPHRRAA